MKKMTKLFALILFCFGITGCFSGIPLQTGTSANNKTYEVSYLFEHDGCKVYRFYDMGNYVYFTTNGDITSIKNDSTSERTVTIKAENKSFIIKR